MDIDRTATLPSLIENNTRYYLQQVLQKCNQHRASIYHWSLNVGIFIIFIVVVFAVLYSCYRSKRTPEEIQQKDLEDQAYILSKIRHYKQERQHIASRSTMTGLPVL
jgi:heme/copper-type cytochrome/quinol oxidase subunit 2